MDAWRARFAWWRIGFFLWCCGSGGLVLDVRLAEASTKVSVVRRFALLVGQDDAGARAPRLHYASRDAEKMQELLISVSGFQKKDIVLLRQTQARSVMAALAGLQRRIARVRRVEKHAAIWLFVYYSGHVKRDRLLLGRSSLGFARLLRMIRGMGASLRFVVVDACESGGMLQKGLTYRREGFAVPFLQEPQMAQGEVILTATGQSEQAHEDPTLKGGIFTHFLISGLRGAADQNRDQRVTLGELYPYVYQRALQHSMFSVHGPQRARFAQRLSGYGDIVLAHLRGSAARLMVEKGVSGRFFLWDKKREKLFAEWTHGPKESALAVALSAKQYVLDWRKGASYSRMALDLRTERRIVLKTKTATHLVWRPLQEPATVASLVRFPKELQGDFVIWDQLRQRPSTRVAKRAGHAVVLELPAGAYLFETRGTQGARHYPLRLSTGQAFVIPADWAISEDTDAIGGDVAAMRLEREAFLGSRKSFGDRERDGFLVRLYEEVWRPQAEQMPMWGSALAWLEGEGLLWSGRPLGWTPLAGYLRLRGVAASEASILAEAVPMGGYEGQIGAMWTVWEGRFAAREGADEGQVQIHLGGYMAFLHDLRLREAAGLWSGISWGIGTTAQIHLSVARQLRLIGLLDYRGLRAIEDRRLTRWRGVLSFSLGWLLHF